MKIAILALLLLFLLSCSPQQKGEEKNTILGPATHIDEEGNIWVYEPQKNAWFYIPTQQKKN